MIGGETDPPRIGSPPKHVLLFAIILSIYGFAVAWEPEPFVIGIIKNA